jgi:trehalose 6-phosphate synthase/phosphatase
VAEHGFKLRYIEQNWLSFSRESTPWKHAVRPVLEFFVDRCPGAFVEEKEYGLAWHYRAADEEAGFRLSRLLLEQLESLQPSLRVLVLDGNKVVEVKKTEQHKGVVARGLASRGEYDFVLAIGDDKTDENMFAAFDQPQAHTVRIGKAPSRARYFLRSQKDTAEFLGAFLKRREAPKILPSPGVRLDHPLKNKDLTGSA